MKQFEQESQLTVYLVLDASASMTFTGGGIAKLEYAGLSLAALAYLVIQQQDKVGLRRVRRPRDRDDRAAARAHERISTICSACSTA